MELVINDRIRNRKVDKFNSYHIGLKYNSIASPFSFDYYYDPDVLELKEMACIGHYHICKLYHNGELILTGQMLSEAFNNQSVKDLVAIGGYSITGILEDSSIPTNSAIDAAIASGNLKLPAGTITPYCYPLQSDGLSLKQIAEKLLAPFKLQMVIDPDVEALMNEVFTESTADAKDTVKNYLTQLATQKNINITHNSLGQVVFTKTKTNLKPIHFFDVPKGGLPGVKMGLHFNGSGMHSQITVMKQADADDENAGESTITNPYVPYVFRHKTIIQSSGNDIDTELAAKNALSEELRNLSFTVSVDRWTFNDKLIRPGNLITVRNPEIYLFNKTNLFIESVDLSGNQKENTAVMHCVLAEVYNDLPPKYIFAGINLH
jgi:hypothetical protein